MSVYVALFISLAAVVKICTAEQALSYVGGDTSVTQADSVTMEVLKMVSEHLKLHPENAEVMTKLLIAINKDRIDAWKETQLKALHGFFEMLNKCVEIYIVKEETDVEAEVDVLGGLFKGHTKVKVVRERAVPNPNCQMLLKDTTQLFRGQLT